MPDPNSRAFLAEEIGLMDTQVKIYRCATLLILHRLRYAFSERDDTAAELARNILIDIGDVYRHHLTIGPRVQGIQESRGTPKGSYDYRLAPPFLVAAVEAVHPRERDDVRQKLPFVVCEQMYPNLGDIMTKFLKFVWKSRDAGYRGRWFDLVRDGPSLVLL